MRCGRRSGAAAVAVQVHDLAFKALALHVGLERLIDPRRGFARVRPCLQGRLDARLIQCAFATGLAGSSTPAVKASAHPPAPWNLAAPCPPSSADALAATTCGSAAHRAGFAPFKNGVESIGDREFDGGGGREF